MALKALLLAIGEARIASPGRVASSSAFRDKLSFVVQSLSLSEIRIVSLLALSVALFLALQLMS